MSDQASRDHSSSEGSARQFVALAGAFFLLAISTAATGIFEQSLGWVGPFGWGIAAFCSLAKAGEIRASKTGKTMLKNLAVTGVWAGAAAFIVLAAFTMFDQMSA